MENGNGVKTIEQQKTSNEKAVQDAMKETLSTYTNKEAVSRINKSMREIASMVRVSNDQAVDAFWFKRLKLWKEEVFGGFKTLNEYAEKKMGLTDSKAVKSFVNQIAYRAGIGAELLGKVEQNGNNKTEKNVYQKVEAYIDKAEKSLTVNEIEKLIGKLEAIVVKRHVGPITSPASGTVETEQKEAVAA